VTDDISATEREVGNERIAAGEAFTVKLRRRYDSPIEDVWSAFTEPDRLRRWFLPVTGDLRVGGTFDLEGNASGEILHCEPPHRLRVTWVYGDRTADEVELRLTGSEDGTTVELEHASVTRMVEVEGRMVDVILNDSETGIWGLGTGWEMGLIGLGRFLRGELSEGPAAESFDESSPELLQLADRCGRAWAAAVATSTKDE
jgi:uncharacterized protein YndB with AHSA1/START domain